MRLPWLLLALCCGVLACAAPVVAVPPETVYVQAVQHRFGGDAQGYYNTLLDLAQQHPESRAGRRARATLRGTDWLAQAMALGAVAQVVAPMYTGVAVPDPRQSAAKRQLRSMAELQQRYFADHGHYCSSFAECGVKNDAPPSGYLFFLSREEVWGEGPAALRTAARFALEQQRVQPHVESSGFVIAAAGNLDGDPQLDVWVIDELMRLVHVSNDL